MFAGTPLRIWRRPFLLTGLICALAAVGAQPASGNGGNTTAASSRTNIFSPATSVDYKRSGGEPTVTVDRYPFTAPFTCTPAPDLVGFDEARFERIADGEVEEAHRHEAGHIRGDQEIQAISLSHEP